MDDILGLIFGRYLIELLGASVRFLYGYVKTKLFGAKYIKFENYWSNEKGNSYNKKETGTANRIAGFLFILIIIGLVFLLF